MGAQAPGAVGQIEAMEINAECRKYTAIVLSVLTGLYFTQESIFFPMAGCRFSDTRSTLCGIMFITAFTQSLFHPSEA